MCLRSLPKEWQTRHRRHDAGTLRSRGLTRSVANGVTHFLRGSIGEEILRYILRERCGKKDGSQYPEYKAFKCSEPLFCGSVTRRGRPKAIRIENHLLKGIIMKVNGVALVLICIAATSELTLANEAGATLRTGVQESLIQIGNTSFSGESIRFESSGMSQSRRVNCTLEGRAQLILSDTGIEITADNIQFELNGESLKSMTCTGSCRYKESEDGIVPSGEKLEFGDGVCVSGTAKIQYGSGQYKTTAQAESIVLRRGKLEFSGIQSIQLGR